MRKCADEKYKNSLEETQGFFLANRIEILELRNKHFAFMLRFTLSDDRQANSKYLISKSNPASYRE
jgi:hypothetical protein